jgi:hypothetical protein
MSDVHYFPRYSQRENVITNNTLLLLLRLYDHDRFKFGRFLRELFADDVELSGVIGLQFKQQRGTGMSVVDGFVAQESIKIVVETKRSDESFHIDQLRHHLGAFTHEDYKLLVLLSPAAEHLSGDFLEPVRRDARARGVAVVLTSFERIIGAARASLSDHDEGMRALVEDFAVFCSEEGLLPRDRYLIFVPPCGQSFDDNVQYRLYYCPTTWSRRRTAWIGIYKDKSVRKIGRIAKTVTCEIDRVAGSVTCIDRGVTLTPAEKERIVGAAHAAVERGWDIQQGHRFFLCDELVDTDYRKVSAGGIQGHRYFDLGTVLTREIPSDARELGVALATLTWE